MHLLQEHFENYANECEFVKRLRPATIRGSKEAFAHFVRMMPEVTVPTDISHSMITTFFKRLQTRERIVGKGTKVVGIKDSTLRAARRSGLPVYYKHGRGYVLGQDWIQYIRSADDADEAVRGTP